VVPFCQRNCLSGAFFVNADTDDSANMVLICLRQNDVKVVFIGIHVKMTMTVDEKGVLVEQGE
jgi:hypothetical protein